MSKRVKWSVAGGVLLVIVAIGGLTAAKGKNKAVEVRTEQVQQRDPFAEIAPAHLRAIFGRNGRWRGLLVDELFHGQSLSVMAGLVPAIHALLGREERRGCPAP